MWEYKHDAEDDKTLIYHDGVKVGSVDGKINSWTNGYPSDNAREVIKKAVDDPMIVDLLYGFSELEE